MTMQQLPWGVVALLSLTPALAPAQTFGDLQVVKGMDALQSGDDARALMQLAPVADGPNRGDMWLQARFWAAEAAGNLGLSEQALPYLQDLEKSLPEVADFVWAERARALRGLNRWSDAKAAWDVVLNQFPRSPLRAEAMYSLADCYYALNDTQHAYDAYTAALRAYSKSDRAPIARFNVARMDEAQHRFSSAATAYRQLASGSSSLMAAPAGARLDALVQTKAAAPTTFSQRLSQLDRLLSSRALSEASDAIEALKPSANTPAYRFLLDSRRAQLAYRKQDFDTAIGLYIDLVKATAGRQKLENQRALATAYSAADRFDDAVAIYRDIAAHYRGAREGREAQYRAGWLAYNGGNYALALDLFGEFLQQYGTDRSADEAMWYVAWNAYHMGDMQAAIDTLVKLRKTYRRSQLIDRTYYWEGRMQARLGHKSEAIAAYTRAANHPASYYGFLALQRINELQHDGEPQAWQSNPQVVASLGSSSTTMTSSTAIADHPPMLGEDAISSEMRPTTLLDNMPWGASVFDWNNADGQRIMRLMKLGLKREAAKAVQTMPAIAGLPRSLSDYSRARILYGLGDYGDAYRVVSNSFRSELDGSLGGHARRYFQIAYPDAHSDMVQSAAREFHISPLLVLAIMRQESAFDDQANSWASARGLMQIIPVTGRRIAEVLQLDPYNDGVLREPVVNVRFGTWYLSQLVQKFEGNYILAIGSYNAGPQAMQRWVDSRAGCASDEFIEDIPYRETRHYVKNVLANLAVYAQLYGNEPMNLPASIPSSYRDNVNF